MNYLLEAEQTDRLVFRKLSENDFYTWLHFFKDPLSNKYWSGLPVDPEAQCRAWFDKIFWRYNNDKGGMNALIDKKTGDFIGQCGLLIQTVDGIEELEVGYSIMPEFRNKGYASEAAQKCVQFAFENDLRDSIISIIHVDNVESQKVAQKINMVFEKQTTYGQNPVKIFRIQKK